MDANKMKEIARNMANKVKILKRGSDNPIFKENKRYNPIYSELKGMEHTLKTLGIEFHYIYNDEIEIIAVNVEGYRAEC